MDLLERVEIAIDTVRPYLEADGGYFYLHVRKI